MRYILLGMLVLTAARPAEGAAFTLMSTTNYAAPAGGDCLPYALVISGDGCVIVVGSETGSVGGTNWRIRKYDPTMSLLLASTDYDGPSAGTDVARAVAVDGSGNVVVAGYETGTTGGENWLVRKYDPTLSAALASTSFDGPSGGQDQASGVAIDGSGNIVAAGFHTGPAKTWHVRKYDSSLATLLSSTNWGESGSFVEGVAVRPNGNVVCAGSSDILDWPSWRVVEYDPTLSSIVGTDAQFVSNGPTVACAVALAESGRAVVVGHAFGEVAWGNNWRIRNYPSPIAAELSTTVYGIPGVTESFPGGVAIDRCGNVAVVGAETATGIGTGNNWRIREYDASLTSLMATTLYDGPAGTVDGARSVAIDPSGNLVVAGYETAAGGEKNWRIRRYGTAGLCAVPCSPDLTLKVRNPEPLYVNGGEQQLWRIAFSNSSVETAYNLTITTQGGSFDQRTYVAPSFSATVMVGAVTPSWATASAGPWVDGEPPNGTGSPLYLRWVVSSVPPGRTGRLSYRTLTATGPEVLLLTYASATLSCEPVFPSGASLSYSDTSTGKRIELPLVWIKTRSGTQGMPDEASAVAVDVVTDIHVAGRESRADIGQADDWFEARYDHDGVCEWSLTRNGLLSGDDSANGVGALDYGGAPVFVAGSMRTFSGQGTDAAIERRMQSGQITWTRTYNGAGNGDDAFLSVTGLATDPVAVGYEDRADISEGKNWLVQRFSGGVGGGALLWSRNYDSPAHGDDVATAVSDWYSPFAVVGYETRSDLGQGRNWLVRVYESDGTLRWSRSYNSPANGDDEALGVIFTPAGDTYVVGNESRPDLGQGENWRIIKYNIVGEVMWSIAFDGPANGDDSAQAITNDAFYYAGDNDTNIEVAGYETVPGQGRNWVVRRLDNAGNVVATVSHNGLINGDEAIKGIWRSYTSSSDNDVIVVGSETVRDEDRDIEIARVRLAAFDPPAVPIGLTATGHIADIGLAWTVSIAGTRPISGYRIYRQTSAGVTDAVWLADVPGAASSRYTDASVVSGVTYFYRVLAVDSLGAVSLLSNEAYAAANCGTTAWTARPAVPAVRISPAAIGMNGTLYVAGGYDGSYLTRIDAYHPDFGTWTHVGDMPTARYGLGIARFGGNLFFFTGANTGGLTNKNEQWDPVSNTWWTRAPIPTARFGPGCATVGGSAYLIGGDNGSSMAIVEAYDLVFDSWTTKAPMPTPRSELGAAAIDGIIYAVGGTSGGGPLNMVEAYNPATNTWTTKAPMHVARFGLGVAVVGGTLYAVGGDNAGFIGTVEAYDPNTNSWTLLCGLTTGRASLAVADVGATVYAVAGWNAGYLSSVEAAVYPKGPAKPFLAVSKTGDKGTGACGTTVTYDVTVAYPPIEDSLFHCGDDQSAGTVTLADAMPAGMTYVPGSLRLSTDNGATFGPLTDGADADAGEAAGGTITVRLGAIPEGDGDWNCNIAGTRIVRFSASHTGIPAGLISNTAFVDYLDAAGVQQPRAMSSWDFTGGGCPPPPAVLSVWIDAPAAVVMGTGFTATVWVANTGVAGALTATVTGIAVAIAGVPSGPAQPALPVSVAAGGLASFRWTATAYACGPAILTATVTGGEAGTGGVLGPVVVGRGVSVAGYPDLVEVAALSSAVAAGGVVTLTVTVYDSCGPRNPVPGAPVSLAVVAGGGTVSPISGITDAAGRLIATLTTGDTPGANAVRVDVTAGARPSSTVYVATTAAPAWTEVPLLTYPGAAADKNVFAPGLGQTVLARILPLDDSGIAVEVFTASGRLVRTIRRLEPVGSGQFVARWDGRTEDEAVVARGVYLIHVRGGGLNEVLKVIVR